MGRTPTSVAALCLVATATLLLLSSSAEAKPRPTVDDPNGDTCFNDPTTDKNCPGDVGSICYCCYDDGCWICGTTPLPGDECVWDGKYSSANPPKPSKLPRPGLTPPSGIKPLTPVLPKGDTNMAPPPKSISPGN